MNNDELVDLLSRCALRDQKAFDSLYKLTASYLNAVAYRIVGSQESSNDVLQEAFVQIWDKASAYAPHQSNALTWMASIVRYRAIDKIKSEQRHRNRPPAEEEEDILLNLSGGNGLESEYQHYQNSEQIHRCLASMNEKFSRCVKLAYIYGYSREELAETLSSNLNTVKSWLRRGSVKFKECMEGVE